MDTEEIKGREETAFIDARVGTEAEIKPLVVAGLNTLPGKALRETYQQVMHQAPPPRASRHLLRGNIAWVVQARQQGQDPDTLAQSLLRKLDKVNHPRKDHTQAGTRPVREWQGQVHEVLVLEKGYRYQGKQYRSLSRIVEVITGAHWSGPRFFGLNKNPVSKPTASNNATVATNN